MELASLLDFAGLTTGELERGGLIMARLSGLFLAAPFFSRATGPVRIRVALLIMLTLTLHPVVPPWSGEGKGHPSLLFSAAVAELLLGAVVGLFAHWVFAAIQLAGSVMGFEMGLSMAQVMDPTSGAQEGVVATLLYFTALILFLIADAHHLLLASLAGSFQTVPLGAMWDPERLLSAAIAAVLRLFKLGILLAAPVIVVSKMLYIGLGLINRASPQIQVFFLSMPITQVLGFLITGMTLAVFGKVVLREMEAFLHLGMNLVGG